MGDVLNLDSLMGPAVKSGYPGPTLADLVKNGFDRRGLFMIKSKDGKVIEAYKQEKGEQYYTLSTVEAFETYFSERIKNLGKYLRPRDSSIQNL